MNDGMGIEDAGSACKADVWWLMEELGRCRILSVLSTADRARLLPFMQERSLGAGETLSQAGGPARLLHLLVDGELEVFSRNHRFGSFGSGLFGEEAVLGRPDYLYTLQAAECGARVLTIDGEGAGRILEGYPKARHALMFSLTRFLDDKTDSAAASAGSNPSPSRKETGFGRGEAVQFIGWVLALLLPALIFYWQSLHDIPADTRIFMAVFASTVVLWMFELVPDFVAGLLSVLVVLILGITPSNVILSGFQSSSFFMALSIFALAAVVVSSGLLYRLSLLLICHTRPSNVLYNFMITMAGLLMTPILPSANGRVELIMPLLDDVARAVGYRRPGNNTNQLAASAFMGVALFSPLFLTSKSINFVIYGMFPAQIQDSFQWLNWFWASSVAGGVLLLLHLVASLLWFRHLERPVPHREHVNRQLQMLGPMTLAEWGALIGIGLLMVGVVTTSFHTIKPAWIGLALMFVFLAIGTLGRKDFQRKLDWPFLFMLGTLIGLAKAISHLGIDKLIGSELGWLTDLMRDDLYLFVFALALIIFIIRFALSINAAVVVVASVLLPISQNVGISPWVIGFMILMFCEGFVLPYQCSYYYPFARLNNDLKLFEERSFLLFNLWSFLIRLVAVYASIPFWRSLEIIR